MSKGIVLVIDDEADIIELVRYNLEKEGFDVLGASDGETGFSLAVKDKPDVLVVDLMLPGIDGLDVCRMLRAEAVTSHIPIIILTAKASESDRVVGLELGADDYLTKPFSPRELTARIKALRRRSVGNVQPPAVLRHGSLSIDAASHEVRCGNKLIDLTATEYKILHFLASHPGFAYARSSVIDGALGRDITVLERTIDVHVMSLRKKLGKCGALIETIRGFGYKLRDLNSHE